MSHRVFDKWCMKRHIERLIVRALAQGTSGIEAEIRGVCIVTLLAVLLHLLPLLRSYVAHRIESQLRDRRGRTIEEDPDWCRALVELIVGLFGFSFAYP
ncbi:hypothetical protein BGX38DRAFT_1167503 [Terfezia claveryi]|nr:hypothetical protein BGX38DRAFT_1167503 [Terfezia claveryi]